MKTALRTYKDRKILEETNHRSIETALRALDKRKGDTAVLQTSSRTVWFHRKGESWIKQYEMWS